MTRSLFRWLAPVASVLLLLAAPRPGAADTPSALAGSLFGFPGATGNPAGAISAGLALSDRWLGDDPFDNPAASPGFAAQASGALLHSSRQDLRADNRNFDETPAFFGASGLVVGLPQRGRIGLALYACQPVLEKQSSAFSRGNGTPDPANPPATIQADMTAHEMRTGLAMSAAVGSGRIGGAVEWTRRDDHYRVTEESGSPTSGTRQLDFTGDAVGFQVGATLDRGDSSEGGLKLGIGIRYLAPLTVDGPVSEDLLTGNVDSTVSAERESGWQLGTSARYAASPSVRLLASLGGRSAQAWQGFGVDAGRQWEWKLGLDYHDARDPWTLRLGLGQEHQSEVSVTRADDLGLGFGWRFSWLATDLGLVHRSLTRPSSPRSYEDRIVLTLRTP
jgi:hypothetical protein